MWHRDGAHEYVGWSPSCCMVWEKDLVVKGVVGACLCLYLTETTNGTHTIELKLNWSFQLVIFPFCFYNYFECNECVL